ncbi:MAG: glucose-1-phosphate adenylyltransferase [Candidatus Latescibacteria bacterium]|nr:glucose-1-phosphate adenylyltransferase [Candidatus Latescibacterota bacterium]
MEDVVSVILGGGQGTRLYPLTRDRSKPAVPIGSKYRLIDIPISNCLHAGVNKIYVLTQFNSASLHRHLNITYRFDSFSQGFVEILAAEQTQQNANWFQGTADAVRQQLDNIMSRPMNQCLILSGDHLYRMDYRQFLDTHRQQNADVTIAVKPVTRQEATSLGILQVDDNGRIIDFVEKPQTEAELDRLCQEQPISDNPDECYLASMGLYVFEPQVLISLLMSTGEVDFGKNIIPQAIEKVGVYAHRFNGYWEDIGTIRAFYEANLALTGESPPFTFHRPEAPIYTNARFLSGARLQRCRTDRAIIAEGSRVIDATIEHSIIGIRSQIGPGVHISRTVMMGADHYQTEGSKERNQERGLPNIGIGANTRIDGAIIDLNACIGADCSLTNQAGVRETDGDNYYIREGILVVPKNAAIAPGTQI